MTEHYRRPAPRTSPFAALAESSLVHPGVISQPNPIPDALIAKADLSDAVLLVAVIPERAEHDRQDRRLESIARRKGCASVVLGSHLGRHVGEDQRSAHRVPLRPDDPLQGEWVVAVATTRHLHAFAARGGVDTEDGRYEWLSSRDRTGCTAALRMLLERVPHLHERLRQQLSPSLLADIRALDNIRT